MVPTCQVLLTLPHYNWMLGCEINESLVTNAEVLRLHDSSSTQTGVNINSKIKTLRVPLNWCVNKNKETACITVSIFELYTLQKYPS